MTLAALLALLTTACARDPHGKVDVAQTDCYLCHQSDYGGTTSPPHPGLFPITCADCHTIDAWVPAVGFGNHDWFPLTEGHANRDCASCHADGYSPGDTPTECVGCHRPDYDRSPYPGHNVFPLACTDCHDTRAWIPSSFSHTWTLDGAHVGTPCTHCHTGEPPRYEGTPSNCVDCHRGDYERATFPGHDTFQTLCADCHTTATWRGPSFTHPWPLEGAHSWTPCATCHAGDPPVYVGTPTDCVDCHRDDYERSTWPGHNVYPTACATCHGSTTWVPSSFRHDWTLDGAHVGTECGRCHTGDPPVYEGTPTDCVGCHRADYDGATATHPAHDTYALTCTDCHTTTTWLDADFTHEWPLRGAHTAAPCGAGCHGDPPTYAGTSTTCVGCHRADYDGSTFPGHSSFPSTCADCHNNTAWTSATFTHSWPLDGAHTSATCASCHGTPPTYAGTSTTCVGCHRADYDGSTFPGHSAYSTTCTDCHSTRAWSPSSFTHPWPLDGAHATADCAGCHPGSPPRYAGTPTACIDCHRSDYDRSTFPGHDTYPTTCLDCHGSSTWFGAAFTHSWSLAGAHARTPCERCHTGSPPRYAGTPTTCVGCHRSDYDGSAYIPHPTFGTTCTDCHSNVGWTPATAGYHPSGWRLPHHGGGSCSGATSCDSCVGCHDPALGGWMGGANVSCIDGGCHYHDRSREDSRHRGERGYPTGTAPPNFCVACHENFRH